MENFVSLQLLQNDTKEQLIFSELKRSQVSNSRPDIYQKTGPIFTPRANLAREALLLRVGMLLPSPKSVIFYHLKNVSNLRLVFLVHEVFPVGHRIWDMLLRLKMDGRRCWPK